MPKGNRPPKSILPPQSKPLDPLEPNPFEPDPRRTLAVLRVLWAMLLVGQLLLGVVGYYFMVHSKGQPISESLTWKLFGLNSALLVFNILLASFLRNQIYKRFWQGNIVAPSGYFIANVLMFGLLESVVILSVIIAILSKAFVPAIAPGVVALAVYLVNFPHGGPLFEATPVHDETLPGQPES
jgi:hypothetical protein